MVALGAVAEAALEFQPVPVPELGLEPGPRRDCPGTKSEYEWSSMCSCVLERRKMMDSEEREQ